MKVLFVLIACYFFNLNGFDAFKVERYNMDVVKILTKCSSIERLKTTDPGSIFAYKVLRHEGSGVANGSGAGTPYAEYIVECMDKKAIPSDKWMTLGQSRCYNMPENVLSVIFDDRGAIMDVKENPDNEPFLTITKKPKGNTIDSILKKHLGRRSERERLIEVYKYLAENLATLAKFGCKDLGDSVEDNTVPNSALTMSEFAFDKVFISEDKALLDGIAFNEGDAPAYQNLTKVLLAMSFTDVALNNAYMDKAINCDGLFDYKWRFVTMYERILLAAHLLHGYCTSRGLSSEEHTKINEALISDFRRKLLNTIDDIDVLSYGKGVWGKVIQRYDAIKALEGFESSIGKIWKLYRWLSDGKLVIKGDEPNKEYMDLFKESILIYDPITGSDQEYINKQSLLERLKGWISNTAIAKLVKKMCMMKNLYKTRDSEFKDVLDYYIEKLSESKLP